MAAAQTIAVVQAGGRSVSLGDLLGPEFAAAPGQMFGADRFHPSAFGYAVVAQALLPSLAAALGYDERPLDPRCSCVTCRTVSRAYLRHLYANDEIAASVYNTIHNVSFYLDLMGAIRQAIASNSFYSFREGFLSRLSRETNI